MVVATNSIDDALDKIDLNKGSVCVFVASSTSVSIVIARPSDSEAEAISFLDCFVAQPASDMLLAMTKGRKHSLNHLKPEVINR